MSDKDRVTAVDTEFDNFKNAFVATSCDHRMNARYYELKKEKDYEELKRICENPTITKSMFPITVDKYVLRRKGITIKGPCSDPLIAGTLLDENFANRKGLKAMARRYLNHQTRGEEILKKYKAKYKRIAKQMGKEFDYTMIPRHVMKEYATDDAIMTEKLDFFFREPIKRFQQLYDFEVKLSDVLVEMQDIGMRVDRKFVKKQSKQYAIDIENSNARIQKILKKEGIRLPEFKPNSNKLCSYVLKKMGIPLPVTEKGNLSTESKVLEEFEDHAIVREILVGRFIRKQKSSYFDSLIKKYTTPDDWDAHFFIFTSGARTGRTSAQLIQTIPRPDESKTAHAPKLARKAYIPRPGYDLVAIDYKALQMLIFYHFANATKLIEKVKQGWDPHSATCQLLFGEVNKELRKIAKNMGFGFIFGMGVKKLVRSLGVSKAEGYKILNDFYSFVPVREFMRSTVSKLYREGILHLDVESERMSVHREYRVPQQLAYKGPNVLIQGLEAYVVKHAMMRCDEIIKRKGFDARMLMIVHDELLFEVKRNKDYAYTVKKLKAEMEDKITLKVPLLTDVKTSSISWGEAKEIDVAKL